MGLGSFPFYPFLMLITAECWMRVEADGDQGVWWFGIKGGLGAGCLVVRD